MLVPLIVKEVIVPPLYVYRYNVHRCIMHNLRSHISVSCHCFFKGIDFLFQRSLPSRLISPLRVPAAWRRAFPPTPFPLPPRALPRLSDIPPGLTCCLCIKRESRVPAHHHVHAVTRQTEEDGVRAEPAEEAHRGGGGHRRL